MTTDDRFGMFDVTSRDRGDFRSRLGVRQTWLLGLIPHAGLMSARSRLTSFGDANAGGASMVSDPAFGGPCGQVCKGVLRTREGERGRSGRRRRTHSPRDSTSRCGKRIQQDPLQMTNQGYVMSCLTGLGGFCVGVWCECLTCSLAVPYHGFLQASSTNKGEVRQGSRSLALSYSPEGSQPALPSRCQWPSPTYEFRGDARCVEQRGTVVDASNPIAVVSNYMIVCSIFIFWQASGD